MGKIIPFQRRRNLKRRSSPWNPAPKPPKGPSNFTLIAIGLSMGGAIGGGIIFGPDLIAKAGAQGPIYQAQFGLCHTGGGQNCVVDGDTFWVRGERVRVMDIDAPETHPPRCPTEAALGERATIRLRELLNEGPFKMEADGRDEDQYGRKLRIVSRSGESIGSILIDEGLAREWAGSRKSWC